MSATASHDVCASMDAHILTNWLDGPTALKPDTVTSTLPDDILTSTAPDLTDTQITQLLTPFDVDIHNGFIPTEDPLTTLPLTSKFAPWELLMLDLGRRLHAHNVRASILALPTVRVLRSDLPSKGELLRAQLVLSMLAHSYVWGEEPVLSTLPACIAVPWVTVSHRLGRVPVLTHSSIILSNWKRLDPKGEIRLHNVGLLNSFYGGIDEAIFYLVTLEVEAVGAAAIAHMIRAHHYVRTRQPTKLTAALTSIAATQHAMTAALMLMYKDCDPYIFYTRVRVFLNGWRGNPRLPDGLLYEGVSEWPQLFHGGSAAQSCIVAVMDSFLGVGHERVQTAQFMRDMRFYMPGLHREFLRFIETSCSVRAFVEEWCYGTSSGAVGNGHLGTNGNGHATNGHGSGHSSASSSPFSSASNSPSTSPSHQPARTALRDPELVAAYNACVDELVVFRTKHIGIVALYILAQAHNSKHKIPPTAYAQPSPLPTPHSSPLPPPHSSHSHTTPLPHSISASTLSASASHGSLLAAVVRSGLSASSTPASPLSPVGGDGEGEGVAVGERGTGGTSIMPYLKTSRDETKQVRF